MALKFEKAQAAVPPGTHTGIIVEAEETTRDFGKGQVARVCIVIQPNWKREEGTETLPLEVLFTPSLNTISQLSKFLTALNAHPQLGEDVDFKALIGREVQFDTYMERNYAQVNKESIVPYTRPNAAPASAAKKPAK